MSFVTSTKQVCLTRFYSLDYNKMLQQSPTHQGREPLIDTLRLASHEVGSLVDEFRPQHFQTRQIFHSSVEISINNNYYNAYIDFPLSSKVH